MCDKNVSGVQGLPRGKCYLESLTCSGRIALFIGNGCVYTFDEDKFNAISLEKGDDGKIAFQRHAIYDPKGFGTPDRSEMVGCERTVLNCSEATFVDSYQRGDDNWGRFLVVVEEE